MGFRFFRKHRTNRLGRPYRGAPNFSAALKVSREKYSLAIQKTSTTPTSTANSLASLVLAPIEAGKTADAVMLGDQLTDGQLDPRIATVASTLWYLTIAYDLHQGWSHDLTL